ncbi:MAG: co-chaperone GroES [Sulfurospirillum sp.]|nr:co-chaperone GroES [Sulfurospirillum sp.]MBL0703460.1 co-chaperone GroES [Sulfurospirillum sp.]
MAFKPLGKRVLIERVEEAKTTSTGIIIPDNAKEKPLNGKVIAVSKDVKGIAVNDTVVFGKYAGSELTLNTKEYLVMEYKDILGILK